MKNILLVEDDRQDVELTLAAMARNNMANHVHVVVDGAECLDYLYCRGKHASRTNGNPILVMLDNKMPKVSGLEVLQAMKADPSLRTIPVVVLTSSRDTTDLTGFYGAGANAYVVKPLDFSEFTKAVQSLGIFWALINEPPPIPLPDGVGEESHGVIVAGAGRGSHETKTQNPAP